tara:strand:- start:747 stop:1667 length:921 start_codon:yes stop_codon:yes gene_type:complete
MIIPAGPTENRGGRGKSVTYGGVFSGTYKSDMNIMDIATTGSAVDFGNASKAATFSSGMASATRGVFKQGRSPSTTGIMEYVTFSSGGGVAEFGSDEGIQQDSSASSADGVRGIFGNGTGYDAVIRSINIASTGDSSTFGTLTSGRYMGGGAGGASPTRGFFFGGLISGQPAGEKIIETVTFASGGEATKFGELTVGRRAIAAVTNNTRAVSCSGDTPATNTMDFIVMATEGNATDFGDITNQAAGYGAGGSNATRGVITGCSPSNTNRIDYITFSTTGNATDFGDTTYGSYLNGACSDSHGGLGE